jgi:hypothetical protein
MSMRFTAALCGLIMTATPAAARSYGSSGEAFATPDPIPDNLDMPGDGQLDCRTIRAEAEFRLKQYDQIGKEAEAIDYKKGAGTRALEALGTVGGAVPVIGSAISMGAMIAQMETTREDAKANYGAIDRRAQWVLDRMSHMHELYQAKCTGGGR